MITLSIRPDVISVGEATDVLLRLTNTGTASCTSIRLTLVVPPQLLILYGDERLHVDRLDGGQSYDHVLSFKAQQLGRLDLRASNISYRSPDGEVVHGSELFTLTARRPIYTDEAQLTTRLDSLSYSGLPAIVRSKSTAGSVSAGAEAAWDRAALRDLLRAAFSDEELVTLCFDHFSPVYEDLAGGMSKGQKIQRLLDYCVRTEQLERLIATVQAANPAQYRRFAAKLRR